MVCMLIYKIALNTRRCNHDPTHRVCARIGVPDTSFWKFTGQSSWCGSISEYNIACAKPKKPTVWSTHMTSQRLNSIDQDTRVMIFVTVNNYWFKLISYR